MSNDIPEWAIEEFCKRASLMPCRVIGSSYPPQTLRAVKAGAKLIAEHEEPPVDPLLIEAREAYATLMERIGSTGAARQIRKGNSDGHIEMSVAKEALKRGIEIGKGEQ